MSDQTKLLAALARSGNLVFPGNEDEAAAIREQMGTLRMATVDGADYWHTGDKPGPCTTRIKTYPTGHHVFYDSSGNRFLFTDPEGRSLHE